MESNSYDFYSKRFDAQDTSKNEHSKAQPNNPAHTNGAGVEHAISAQRSQAQQSSSVKTYTRTLTQLENVKTIDKENFPNRFIVLEGGERNGASTELVESRMPRIHTTKATPKRPLQCLESLAKSAGDSAAEYEAANVLLTLDKPHNSATVRPKIRVAESRSDVEHGQQVHKTQEQTNLNSASNMSNENDTKQMVESGAQTPMLHEHQTGVGVVVSQTPVNAIQQNATALTPIQPMQAIQGAPQHAQQLSDWGMQGRVQVIQQPIQNNSYIQQLYNAQGPILMPGNIALHPSINSQQIQVITASKPFQGNLTSPHVLTQGKQVLQGQTETVSKLLKMLVTRAPFSGYIPTSQNQTFVFSPLNVSHLSNSQPSILPAHSQATVSTITQPQKSTDMQKAVAKIGKVSPPKSTSTALSTQCVKVSQPLLQQTSQTKLINPLQTGGHTMQFAPWQISGALPQVWTGGLQAGTLSAGGLLAPNPIFIRAPQADASTMFIQHSSQSNLQHSSTNVTCQTTPKPRETPTKMMRQVSPIMPSSAIRPASSVSTQTASNRTMIKYRNKLDNVLRNTQTPAAKQDAANQTNKVHNASAQSKQQVAVANSNTQTSTAQEKHLNNKTIQSPQVAVQPTQQAQPKTQQVVQHFPQGAITTMQHTTVNQTIPMAAMPQTISMMPQIHSLTGIASGTLVQPSTAAPLAQILPAQPQTIVQGSLVQTSAGVTVQNSTAFSHTGPLHTTGLQATLEGTFVATSPLIQLLAQEASANTLASTQLSLQSTSVGLIAQPMVVSTLPQPQPQPQPKSQQQPQTVVTEIKSEAKVEKSVSSNMVTVQSSAATQVTATLSTSLVSSVTSSSTSVSDTRMTTSVTFALTAPVVTVSTTTEAKTPKPVLSNSLKKKREASPVSRVQDCAKPVVVATSSPTTSVPTTSHVVTAASTTTTAASAGMSGPSSTKKATTMAPDTSRSNSLSQCYPSVDKTLPKAMIKPILTHVIEGYVIQEASEPFAVNRPFRDWSADKSAHAASTSTAEEHARKKIRLELIASTSTQENAASTAEVVAPPTMKIESATLPIIEPVEPQEMMEVTSAADIPDVRRWTMSDVRDFIRTLPGGADYADAFYAQEVDGLALLLIRPEHLVMALHIKLGPALKIVASINAIRPEPEEDPDDPE